MVAEEGQGGHAALWVFDDYNTLAGERIMGGEPVYWQDPAHFNYEFGARMMAAMFGNAVFGTQVTPDGVSAAYAALLRRRERYLAEAPWFLDELRALAAPPVK